jgi:hypothetical protein
MLGAKRFSQVIVASNGTMARMHTVAPDAFIKIKRALSTSRSRDPLKKPKDALQANIVDELVREFLIGASGS